MVNVKINDVIIPDIELFIFDKDGTIIDLFVYWSNMIALRAEGICNSYDLDANHHKEKIMFEMGVDLEKKRLKPEGPVGLLPRAVVQKAAEDYLQEQGLKDCTDACFSVFQEVDKTSVDLLNEFVKPIPGALELLRQIQECKCLSAIATTDKRARAELAMQHLDVRDLFASYVGADDVNKSKPDPEMIKRICDQLRVDPKRAVMVGDAKTDVKMGINAGCAAAIGVCTGLTARKDLESLTPYVIDDISGIIIK